MAISKYRHYERPETHKCDTNASLAHVSVLMELITSPALTKCTAWNSVRAERDQSAAERSGASAREAGHPLGPGVGGSIALPTLQGVSH